MDRRRYTYLMMFCCFMLVSIYGEDEGKSYLMSHDIREHFKWIGVMRWTREKVAIEINMQLFHILGINKTCIGYKNATTREDDKMWGN